jgi:two-component system response regulator HydG
VLAAPAFQRDPILPLRDIEEAYIAFVIDECEGNKTRAAELLGIDVSTLHRRTKRDGHAR